MQLLSFHNLEDLCQMVVLIPGGGGIISTQFVERSQGLMVSRLYFALGLNQETCL